MGWLVVAVLGLVVGGVGLYEANTERHVIPRPGSDRSPRVDGYSLALIGAIMLLCGSLFVLGAPTWVGIAVFLALAVVLIIFLAGYKPKQPGGRPVDPPDDPDGVWRRSPPGY